MADEQQATAEKDEQEQSKADAEARKKEQEDARNELKELEEADEVPKDPRDWPDGKAKFLTFDVDGDEPYGEGPTEKLGPAHVQHHEDGSVSVGGEKVDDPDEFKGEPIPGGPTDPNAAKLAGEDDRSEDSGDDDKDDDGD